MKDQVTPEDDNRENAKARILKDMRAIRRRLDPRVRDTMDDFARKHAPQTQAKAGEKEQETPKIPEGHIPYDRDRAMEAVGQFIAGKKHDQEFMAKILKLFTQAKQK